MHGESARYLSIDYGSIHALLESVVPGWDLGSPPAGPWEPAGDTTVAVALAHYLSSARQAAKTHSNVKIGRKCLYGPPFLFSRK